MPFVKIWIHAVWATKRRAPLLEKDFRKDIFQHIIENGSEKGILIYAVNGHADHVHCLFRLKNDQTISKVMQMIKGEASFWVNKNLNLKDKLQWQDEYFAVSVSESNVNNVRNYINNQEEHHKKKTYAEEYDEFINNYGFKVFNDID